MVTTDAVAVAVFDVWERTVNESARSALLGSVALKLADVPPPTVAVGNMRVTLTPGLPDLPFIVDFALLSEVAKASTAPVTLSVPAPTDVCVLASEVIDASPAATANVPSPP